MSDGKINSRDKTNAVPTKKRIVKRTKSPDTEIAQEPAEPSEQTATPKKRKIIRHKSKVVEDASPSTDTSLWLLEQHFSQQKESLKRMFRSIEKRKAIYSDPNLGEPKGRQQYESDKQEYERRILLSNQMGAQLAHLSKLQKENVSLDASPEIIQIRQKIEDCHQGMLELEAAFPTSESNVVKTDPNARLVHQLRIEFAKPTELFNNISSHLEKTDKEQYTKLSQLKNHIQGLINQLIEKTPTLEEIEVCQNEIQTFQKELASISFVISHPKLIDQFAALKNKNHNVIEELRALTPFIDQLNPTNKNFLTTYLTLQDKTEKISSPQEEEKTIIEIQELDRILSRPDIQVVINRDYTRLHEQLKNMTKQQTEAREGINTFFNLLNQLKSEEMKLLSQIQPPNEKYTQLIENIQQLIQFLNKNKNPVNVKTVASLVKSLKERTDTSRPPAPYTPLTLISKDFFISPETLVGNTKEDTLKELHQANQALITQLSQPADLFPMLKHTISQSILYRAELDSLYRDFKTYWQQTNPSSEEMVSAPSGYRGSLEISVKEKAIRFQNIANELESMFNLWRHETIADSSVIERYHSKFEELKTAYNEKLSAVRDYNNFVEQFKENARSKIIIMAKIAQTEFKNSLKAYLSLIESLDSPTFTYHALPEEVKPVFQSLFNQIETTIKDLGFLVREKIIEADQAQHLIDALGKQLEYFKANHAPSESSLALLFLTDKLDKLFLPVDPTLSAQTLKERGDKLLEHAAKLTAQTHETEKKNLLDILLMHVKKPQIDEHHLKRIDERHLKRNLAKTSTIMLQQKLQNLISRAENVQHAYEHVTFPTKLALLDQAILDSKELLTKFKNDTQVQEQCQTLQLCIEACLAELKETINTEQKFLEYCLKAGKTIPENKGTVATKALVKEIQRNLEIENQLYEGPELSDDDKIKSYGNIQKLFSATIERVQTTLPLAQKFVYVLQFLEDLAAELVAQAPQDQSIPIVFTKLSPAEYLLNKKWDNQKLGPQLEKISPDLPKLASFYRKIHAGYNAYLSGEKTKEPPEDYINRQVEKLKSYTVGHGVVATILEYFRLLWSKISGPKYHLHFFENNKVKERLEKLALPERFKAMRREREESDDNPPSPRPKS